MFDIGWSEMGVILLVALIVIGPKDLPKVARQIGKWSGKARSMAREFQRSLEDMAREAELDDIKNELQKVQRAGLSQTIRDTVDPGGEMERALDPRNLDAPAVTPPETARLESDLAPEAAPAPPVEAVAAPAVVEIAAPVEPPAETVLPEAPAAVPAPAGRADAEREHAVDVVQKS